MPPKPTDIQAYADFVNNIISPKVLFPTNPDPDYTNNLIGAIADPARFSDLKSAFSNRIGILYNKFKSNPDNLKEFLNLLNLLATKEWPGAYSELTAYYVLITAGIDDIKLNVALPPSDSYASETRKAQTNEDVYSPSWNMFADVKRFSHAQNEVLHKIISVHEKAIPGLSILPEYPLSIDEADFGMNVKNLTAELKDFVDEAMNGKRSTLSKNSIVIPGLIYRIKKGGGINTSINFYDPYERAETLKDMVLHRYANKIMKNQPFFLIFVNFPWDNPTDTDSFGFNSILYRSLARRTFMQYRYSSTPPSSIIPKYTGTDTLFEISRHITGLIFIDDRAIKNEEYNSYVFLNPNALNSTSFINIHLGETITANPAGKGSLFEDFAHDNY